jgi:hypothetical protein
MPWYEIRVQDQLDPAWVDWFAGFTISYDTDDSTILRGSIVDQAALHGVIIRVRDLSLTLLSVNQVAPDATPRHDEGT